MSSVLGFLCIPIAGYAIVSLIPGLDMYLPLVFVVIHILTSPKGDDPMLIAFALVITLVSSIFCYLETNESFIISLPLGMFLLILVL